MPQPWNNSNFNVTHNGPELQSYSQMSTPEWMILEKTLFESKIKGKCSNAATTLPLNKGVECEFLNSNVMRLSRGDTSHSFKGDGMAIIGDIVIAVTIGKHTPLIKEAVLSQKVAEKIVLLRLMKTNGKFYPVEERIYSDARFNFTEQIRDTQIFKFSFTSAEEIYYKYKQQTGLSEGKVAFKYSLIELSEDINK